MRNMLSLLLICILLLTGCGRDIDKKDLPYTVGGQSQEDTVADREGDTLETSLPDATAEPTAEPVVRADGSIAEEDFVAAMDALLAIELAEKGYAEAYESKDSREQLTLGIYYNFAKPDVRSVVGNFNVYQDKYWLEIKEYDNYSNVITDIMTGAGADIFYLNDMPFDTFADKGALEDLTPYFEVSEIISKEQILPSIWRAGSVGDKYVGVIPKFVPTVYLVEKGYTENATWTLEEYFALGDKYPDSKLEKDVNNFDSYLGGILANTLQDFIDWEEMTCDFDNDSFRELLSRLKTNNERKYESKGSSAVADALYEKEYLVMSETLYNGSMRKMSNYMCIRDTFLGNYDLVGMPNSEGIPKYRMFYTEMFGMNANSEHKEGAWTFMEFLFSDEYQKGDSFETQVPGRIDVLEELLEAEVNWSMAEHKEFGDDIHHRNAYTGERYWESETAPFTEEDKENFLFIIDNCYRNIEYSNPIYRIVKEEADSYFAGDKSLDEVVRIIQNRANLYMEEMKVN